MVTAADRSLGELARRLDEVAQRFEALANRLDTTYVRKELFDAYKALATTEKETLQKRVADLEDGRKWLSRLIMGFIVVGVLGAVFTVSRVGVG